MVGVELASFKTRRRGCLCAYCFATESLTFAGGEHSVFRQLKVKDPTKKGCLVPYFFAPGCKYIVVKL